MEVVLDTSAVIAVVANEPDKQRLVESTRGSTLVCPRSVHWEVGNAFSAMLRRGRIKLADVQIAIRAYERIPMQFCDVDLVEAVEFANQFGLYAYDAYILICGRDRKSPVMSLDRGLIHVAERAGIETLELSQ